MDIARCLHDYNMEVIRLRMIQIHTRKIRVKKKLEKRILKLKERAVEVIYESYVLGVEV